MSAVIFDLDGVLCSTDEFHYRAWRKLCNKKSLYFDKSLNERLRGIGRRESYQIILEANKKEESDEEIEKSISMKNEFYIKYLQRMDESYVSSEVLNILFELKRRKIKMAVGSSSKNAKFILNKIGLEDYFDVIVDGNMIKHSKPNPEVFLLAASLMDESPKYSIVIEDAESGIEAALSANMIALSYKNTQISFNNDSFHLINNLWEILEYI